MPPPPPCQGSSCCVEEKKQEKHLGAKFLAKWRRHGAGREGREVLEGEDESVNTQESGAVLPGVSCEEGELLGEGIFTK